MKYGLIKHNPLTVYSYNKILDYRCKSVKGYVFVATTGRSGTHSLAKIFQAVNNAVCLHEPYPIMYNDYPQGADKKDYYNKLFNKIKKVYIKRDAKDHSYYVETNHQFIKNFIFPAINYFGNKIRIVHLVRDPVSVAASLYEIDAIPHKTVRGKFYLLDPNDKDNKIKIGDLLNRCDEFKHDLYKCLWYWYEVETRIKMMKNKYSHIPFYRIKTDEINNKDVVLQMFKKLDIPVVSSKLDSLIGIRTNVRADEKNRNIDIEECTSMNNKLLKQMEERYGKSFWL